MSLERSRFSQVICAAFDVYDSFKLLQLQLQAIADAADTSHPTIASAIRESIFNTSLPTSTIEHLLAERAYLASTETRAAYRRQWMRNNRAAKAVIAQAKADADAAEATNASASTQLLNALREAV